MGGWPSLYVWLVVAGAIVLGYVALFLTKKEVAIRPRGIFFLLALCGVADLPLRAVWPKPGYSITPWPAFALTGGEALMLALFFAAPLVYFIGVSFRLLHAAPGAVHDELDEAC
jgi:hypothetical protein